MHGWIEEEEEDIPTPCPVRAGCHVICHHGSWLSCAFRFSLSSPWSCCCCMHKKCAQDVPHRESAFHLMSPAEPLPPRKKGSRKGRRRRRPFPKKPLKDCKGGDEFCLALPLPLLLLHCFPRTWRSWLINVEIVGHVAHWLFWGLFFSPFFFHI